jgi:hypothetical protein
MSPTRIYLDQFAGCTCGHSLGLHRRWDPPCACRACECEGFHQVRRDDSVVVVPVEGVR